MTSATPGDSSAGEGGFAGPPAFRGGGRYSRFVRSLRLVLPLMAGGLLVLAIIWPKFELQESIGAEDLPEVASVLETNAVTMKAARLVGVDEEGRPFQMEAVEARQLEGLMSRVLLIEPKAQLQLKDGKLVTLRADEGEFDRKTEIAEFHGNVVVTHGDEYEIKTESATVEIAEAHAFGNEPVSGYGPAGELNGEGFEIIDRGRTVKVLGRSRLVIEEAPKEP